MSDTTIIPSSGARPQIPSSSRMVTSNIVQPSGIDAALMQLRGVTTTANAPGLRDGGVRNGRSNHGTPKGFENKKSSDTSSKSSAGSKPAQNSGPKKQSAGKPPPLKGGHPVPPIVTAQSSSKIFKELHDKLAGLDQLVAESVRADIALSASTTDAAEHTAKMDGVRNLLSNYKRELGERLLGAVAKNCTELFADLGNTPPPEEEPPNIWALSEVVNYSMAHVVPEFNTATRSYVKFILFILFSAFVACFTLVHFGESVRTYVELVIVLGMTYQFVLGARVPAASPLNSRQNAFIDVKSEISLRPIGEPYLGQRPWTDDIMVYCGYHSNYITHISLHMLEHLKTVKSGSKLTEMNVHNMSAEICLKFPSKYDYVVYQETAIHAHQLFQAARMRRHMTCTFDNHAPLRHDARAWNPT